MTVVHNGIDPAPFLDARPADLPILNGAMCVGTVAHLSAKKGYADLVRASSVLPDIQFFAAGEGPLRSMIESRARGRVKLLGFRDDVPALMNRFDVFCLPAHREPFGLVFLEAMAAGKPVVAYRSGGAPEVIADGETGFLAEPGEPDSLAGRIETLRADPGLRMKMGQAGRQRVLDRFTLDRCASRLAEVFKHVAESSFRGTRNLLLR
jgi:glycosyltransferase involved in cell wall biosynthesis